MTPPTDIGVTFACLGNFFKIDGKGKNHDWTSVMRFLKNLSALSEHLRTFNFDQATPEQIRLIKNVDLPSVEVVTNKSVAAAVTIRALLCVKEYYRSKEAKREM